MKLDIIANAPKEQRTQRGKYTATLIVGDTHAEFEGDYEMTKNALVMQTIESRLRYQARIDIALQPAAEK